jgi:epoxyqueuosine reductase QueG
MVRLMTKEKIIKTIKKFVNEYQNKKNIKTGWREPLIKFADAEDDLFYKLKKIVSKSHVLPKDILKGAGTVIAFFIPFEKETADSNIKGKLSSRKWALAYLETNQLIHDLNNHLENILKNESYNSSIIPATHNFDEESLISNWSHRHAAYIAGLGSFGINNMLITEKGCAGRIGIIISDIKVKASPRNEKEYCLNKAGYNCSRCVERCVNKSLKIDSFDRFKCYEILLKNDDYHSDLALTDVCGKCCVDLPCSFENPLK